MIEFIHTALSFPTLLWSVLLSFCVIYWLMAGAGIFDHQIVDGWLEADIGDLIDGHHVGHHAGHHTGTHSEGDTGAHGLAAILARLGLAGVPFMLMITILAFTGWILSYYAQLFVLDHLPAVLRWLLGVGLFVVSVVVAVILTAQLLRPIRLLLAKLQHNDNPSVLGKVGTVISPYVDGQDGRAEFSDGGAGLILQVRSIGDERYPRGAQVVLVGRQPGSQVYEVMLHSSSDLP